MIDLGKWLEGVYVKGNLFKLGFLFIFAFLATIGLWLRPNLFGFDSYASLAAVRFGWVDLLGFQPFAVFLFELLPDSLFIFKFLMFLSIFISITGFWVLVKHFYEERLAWLCVFLLLGLSPVILFGFGEFENEVFGYPFIVWGFVFFFVFKRKFLGLAFFLLSLGFWFWPGYFLLWGRGGVVVEQQLFSGLINFWLLLLFVFLIPVLKNKKLRVCGLIALLLWLFNAKFFIFLLPFVALAIAEAIKRLENFRVSNFVKNSVIFMSFLRNNWNLVYLLAFFGLIGWNIAFFMQQPTQNDLVGVREALELSKDSNLPLHNDWSYGYWLWSEGFKTKNNPGHYEYDINSFMAGPGIYLTATDLNCVLVRGEARIVGRKEMKIYHC